MLRLSLLLSAILCVSAVKAQPRHQNYYPDGEDFVCINGNNRFTRGLYGTHTAWRLETSDRPVFASYGKPKSYNISFTINDIPLDSTAYCEARYTAGKRTYKIFDERISPDTIAICAIPLADKEGAIFKFDIRNLENQGAREPEISKTREPGNPEIRESVKIEACLSTIRAKRLSRAGDMGADKKDAFEANELLETVSVPCDFAAGSLYFLFENAKEENHLTAVSAEEGGQLFAAAEAQRLSVANSMRIITPDPYINTIGGALAMAADGCWDDTSGVWQHGANGWRMPLNGWRAAYMGDCLGWTDKARTHFDNYAASQVTDVPATIPHPTQDSTVNLARAEKRWGTQMYSNGYICRNPQQNNKMHHYDMNLVYIDELLWHILWTGDLDYARKIFPTIQRHLEWEKRNFDPDNDGLYDAYCCIWASDALYYNSGAVTHSSAYNYRANKVAADIAEKIGIDPTPYRNEATKIKAAINNRLWLKDQGVWAEFQDFMGHKRLHTSPALWTIYHAIDSDVSDVEQYAQATRWIDENIPHIPVCVSEHSEFSENSVAGLQTIATTNWLPYSWSINNVATAEVYHTALAYWQAGRPNEAFKVFKANVVDGMYLGGSPGNFGQISFYDRARGECYRDFSDCVGIASRAVVQGLFGICPDMLNNKIVIRPGFPDEWEHAELHTNYIDLIYNKVDGKPVFDIKTHFATVGADLVSARQEPEVIIENRATGISGTREHGSPGTRKPGNTEARRPATFCTALPAAIADGSASLKTINLSKHFNAKVEDIFKNEYLSPRSPYTTLELPKQGIGDWCSTKETADIKCSEPIVYTSLWDNYPDSVTIPLKGKAEGLLLELAGSTNHMQCRIDNGIIKVYYKDGTFETQPLRNPDNWCPIEQDFYTDGRAFKIDIPRPLRRQFTTGKLFRTIEELGGGNEPLGTLMDERFTANSSDAEIARFNNRRIDGGASVILYLPLDKTKKLSRLTLETLSNDVVIGLMSIKLRN